MRGLQGFKRVRLFSRHQLNLSHWDKIRKPMKQQLPYLNSTDETLYTFFRIYGKVFLRSMITLVGDSTFKFAATQIRSK